MTTSRSERAMAVAVSRGGRCVVEYLKNKVKQGAVLALVTALPGAASGLEVAVPSGQVVSLQEVMLEAGNGLARFRFVAPAINPAAQDALDYPEVVGDIVHLCDLYAIPALAANDLDATQIVLSLSDRPLAFGEVAQDVTQFFAVFTVTDGRCVEDDE